MIDYRRLQERLPIGGFGQPLHYFETLDSTNRYAKELADHGELGGALILADEQTKGRGRGGRPWVSPAGSALTFSVILRPERDSLPIPASLGVFGALVVVDALAELGVEGEIKWPNDVLVNGRKVAGILIEAAWEGETLEYVILGIGINVRKDAKPETAEIDFPATTVDLELGAQCDRMELLLHCLESLDTWYPHLGTTKILRAWDRLLAYKGNWVMIGNEKDRFEGILHGLSEAGQLLLETSSEGIIQVDFGDSHLRLVDTSLD